MGSDEQRQAMAGEVMMRQCAVCGASCECVGREKWCESCITKHRAHVRKMVRFDDIYSHLRLTVQAMDEWAQAYPEAASLVEQSRPALAQQLRAVSAIRRRLHAQEEAMVLAGSGGDGG